MSTEKGLDFDITTLDFEKGGGTIIVVAQDATTGTVLMVAQADRTAVERTIATGEMHYTSRRRGLWHKGATSGNVQRVLSLTLDCDRDALLARVQPAGPSCHTGDRSCFGNVAPADALADLAVTIERRLEDVAEVGAEQSYTRRLLADRNLRLKKLGEEAVELSIACMERDVARVTEECADLLYHMLVAARAAGVSLDDIRAELARRARH